MTPEQLLADLVADGCHVEVSPVGLLINVGHAEFTGPRTIRFCAPYPEHQGHVHEVEGEPVIYADGVALILTLPDGAFRAYFSRDREWPELSGEQQKQAQKIRKQWREAIARHGNEVRFAEFFREAISD
jgi:hypothetical protein